MQIDTGVLFPLVSVLLAVAGFIGGRMTNAKQAGHQTGQVLTELGYIKKGVDSLEKKLDEMQKNYVKLENRVTKLEERMGFYHHE